MFLEISLRTLNRLLKKYNLNYWNFNQLGMNQAREIRDLYYKKGYTQKQISKYYNVCIRTINKIVNNISYKEPVAIAFKGAAKVSLKGNENGN